jgi:decaprenyl-phosphate phosphoribosyltransferase
LNILRPKQWTKNLFIFAVPIAAGKILQIDVLINTLIAILLFSLVSSSIYILNDIQDLDLDKKHPIKSNRPLASGALSLKRAYLYFIIVAVIGLGGATLFSRELFILFTLYFSLQILYIYSFKHIPILDLFTISFGFLIRAISGGLISDIPISQWFLAVTFSGALFIISGKRYSELINFPNSDARPVLKKYSEHFLKVIWSTSMNTCIIFYSLWAIELGNEFKDNLALLSTIPFAFLIFQLSNNIQRGKAEFPEEEIFQNKQVLVSIILWVFIFMSRIYLG